MNDPNKRIDVNLSSLLSLKAELLRKHEEVSKAKSTHLVSNFVPQRSSKNNKTTNKTAKTEESTNKTTEDVRDTYEDTELLKKSRRVLEAKSKLYDKMCRSGGGLNSDENSLVMFNEKKQVASRGKHEVDSSSNNSDDDDDENNGKPTSGVDDDDGDWVEYTDCLGRTRKCLKEDVEFFKKKDKELAGSVPLMATTEPKFIPPAEPPAWFEDKQGDTAAAPPNGSISGDLDQEDTMSMISKSSKIEEIRNNWEKMESENAIRENIHYQNVLFDEARTHGVGYYAFSTDEQERAKQQKELEATRQKTLDAQKIRDDQRLAREKIIAERVRAAQNRQRARAGLPPLEDMPVPDVPPAPEVSPAELKKQAKEAKRQNAKELESLQRETERKQYVRPWDKGKSSSRKRDHDSDEEDDDDDEDEWTYKPEKEPMSQEKWNELKRSERKKEFAPMPESSSRSSHSRNHQQPFVRARIVNEVSNSDEEIPEDDIDYNIAPPPSKFSSSNTNPRSSDLTPPIHEFQSRSSSNASKHQQYSAGGIFSSRHKKPFVRRHVGDDDEETTSTSKTNDSKQDIRNPDFAPPATFEYYGPSSSSSQKQPRMGGVKSAHLESSIEAGLKFLREQSDKETVSNKMKWSSNAGY